MLNFNGLFFEVIMENKLNVNWINYSIKSSNFSLEVREKI